MTFQEAVALIRPAVHPSAGIWADIGAGTGMFTLALMDILSSGKILAVDKSPHALYSLQPGPEIKLEIVEADFHYTLNLPPLDGILMANSLHYATDHVAVLKNVLSRLTSGGTFILIEYDTDLSNPPWVPNPISFATFQTLCPKVGLDDPLIIGTKKSIYQNGNIYSCWCHKQA